MKKIIALCLCIILFLAGCGQDNIAFSVDGVNVERDELVFYMERMLDETVGIIDSEYGVTYNYEDHSFWNTKIPNADKTPMEILQKNAMDEIVRNKIILMQAREYGIISELQYSNQIKDWNTDNENRKKAAANGETVYGVVERTLYTYLNTYFLEKQKEFQEKLLEEKIITVTEKEMKAYYSKEKSEKFPDKTFVDVYNSIHGWIFDEKYEKYVDNLISKSKIKYHNMKVNLDEIL